jgi:hypothetical protein
MAVTAETADTAVVVKATVVTAAAAAVTTTAAADMTMDIRSVALSAYVNSIDAIFLLCARILRDI